MAKDSLGVGGVGLIGLGAAAAVFPGAPAYLAPVAIASGLGIAVYGWWCGHYSDLEKLFLNCNLYIRTINNTIILPRKIKIIKKDYGKDYILTLPLGMSLEDFKQKEKNISQALNAYVEFDYNNGIIIMSVKHTVLQKTYPFTPIHTLDPLELVLGYSRDGVVTLPLSSAPSPHLLIAGETNSGKSVILRGLITQLILDKSLEDIELHLIDPKRVEFNIFRNSSYVKTFAREDEEILQTLRYIAAETDRRYRLLEKAGKVNIKGYNKRAKEKLKYVLLIIDEFADLSSNGKESEETINLVHYIARKARAVGIHLIASTQRPDREVINGRIKANLGNILGLKTSTQVNSMLIHDRPGLELLRGHGHSFLKANGYIEMQSMFLDEEQAKKLIKHTFIKKELVKKSEAVRGYVEIGN